MLLSRAETSSLKAFSSALEKIQFERVKFAGAVNGEKGSTSQHWRCIKTNLPCPENQKQNPELFFKQFHAHSVYTEELQGHPRNGVHNRVRIDDVWSILNWRDFCWVLHVRVASGSILNFRIGSVSSIGALIAATLLAANRFRFPDIPARPTPPASDLIRA